MRNIYQLCAELKSIDRRKQYYIDRFQTDREDQQDWLYDEIAKLNERKLEIEEVINSTSKEDQFVTHKHAGDFVQERYDEINQMVDDYSIDYWAKYIGDSGDTATICPDNARITELFAKLGQHLQKSQDGIYLDIKVDEYGASHINIIFPRVG